MPDAQSAPDGGQELLRAFFQISQRHVYRFGTRWLLNDDFFLNFPFMERVVQLDCDTYQCLCACAAVSLVLR